MRARIRIVTRDRMADTARRKNVTSAELARRAIAMHWNLERSGLSANDQLLRNYSHECNRDNSTMVDWAVDVPD